MDASHGPHGTDNIEAEVTALLEAIEILGDELAARDSGDLRFKVSEPDHCPAVAVLAGLINEIGADWEAYLEREADLARKRAAELSEAYNAVQAKSDEMLRDLETARRIQLQLIPDGDDMPERSELACAGFYQPMENLGGDLYDVIRIGKNAYGILMADVSGHGLPSALITALVKVAFRTRARWGVDPGQTCAEVNAELFPILSDLDYYVTAYYGVLNLENGEFRYVNCGHHPAIRLPAGDEEMGELDTRGRFLGAFDTVDYQAGIIQLQPGDSIFIYTDGIIESRNFLDEEYGLDRLRSCLEKSVMRAGAATWAPACIDGVRRDLDNFTMGAPARDDMSMLAFQFYRTCPPDAIPLAPKPHQDSSRQNAVARYLVRQALDRFHADRYQECLDLLQAATCLAAPKAADLALKAWALHRLARDGESRTVLDEARQDADERVSTSLNKLSRLLDRGDN